MFLDLIVKSVQQENMKSKTSKISLMIRLYKSEVLNLV